MHALSNRGVAHQSWNIFAALPVALKGLAWMTPNPTLQDPVDLSLRQARLEPGSYFIMLDILTLDVPCKARR